MVLVSLPPKSLFVFAPRALIILGSLVSVRTLVGQSELEILDITIPQDDVMWIDFVDRGEEVRSYSLLTVVELSASIAAWTILEEAELMELEDLYQFEVVLESDPHRFFRVIAYGDSSDVDGDGLSNEVEAQLGTNAFIADTDGDGFSDGVEVENETDPLDAESTPDASVLSTVSFSSDEIVSYDESAGSIFIDLISSDSAFSGLVHYQLSTMSSLDSRDHSPLTGIVEMVNGVGRIELILSDDSVVENVESVVIDLLPSEEGVYRLVYPERSIVVVEDNDSYWIVRLRDADGNEASMRALLYSGESGSGGVLIGSEGGAGPEAFGGSLPEGDWPLEVTWSETEFFAESGQIPLGSSMLIDAEMQRHFRFEATPPQNAESPERAYLMERNRIIGEMVEHVSSVDGASAYLESETRHLFIMIRSGADIEKGEVPLVEDD